MTWRGVDGLIYIYAWLPLDTACKAVVEEVDAVAACNACTMCACGCGSIVNVLLDLDNGVSVVGKLQ